MSVVVEVVRKVIDEDGNLLLVQPSPDNPEYVEITPHPLSVDWYGKFSLSITPELAHKLAYAILETVKEVQRGS